MARRPHYVIPSLHDIRLFRDSQRRRPGTWRDELARYVRAWLDTFETFEIPQVVDGEEVVYLRRWILIGGRERVGRRLMVHEILRSDEGRDLHDHPWDFISVGLHGSYLETYHDGTHRRFDAPWIRLVRAEQLHRLDLIGRANGTDQPVWTLVITGPKRRHWGFLQGDKWVPWREYVGTHDKALEHVQVNTDPLPWSDPDSDPIGDILRYVKDGGSVSR